MRTRRSAKPTAGHRRSTLRSGILTAVSLATVGAAAAGVAVLIARDVGRGAVTDGFFAAYAAYLILTLAAATLRVVALPAMARALEAGRIREEVAAFGAAITVVAVPAVLAALTLSDTLARLVAGGLPAAGEQEAAATFVWLVPAAVAQLYAAVAAAGLGAFDEYGSPALGAGAGALAALVVTAAAIGDHGLDAVRWALAANGAVTLAVPAVALFRRTGLPRRGRDALARLRLLAAGVAIPFALQALFLIAVSAASSLSVGTVTNLSYAYLFASTLVATTSSSIGFVSSVPLARVGLDARAVARHVVSASWIAMTAVAAAAGVFAVAGAPIVEAALGPAFGGEGDEIGRLIAYLGPWTAASIALSLTFPLMFVAQRARYLPAIALGSVLLHVAATAVARDLWGVVGIVAALATTTVVVLIALLAALSRDALRVTTRGLVPAMAIVGALAVAAFASAAALFGTATAAIVGAAAYAGVLLALRPRPLRDAWNYLRTLG